MKEEPISIADQAEQYIKTNTELYTLKITGKIAEVVSTLIAHLVVGLFGFVVLFLLTMGLALWISDIMGNNFIGFFIMAAVLGVLTLLSHRLGYTMIRKPMMNSIITQILKERENE